MAPRIRRAKARLRATNEPFALRRPRPDRLRSVLHVLFLIFNEGYSTSSGPDLARTDLSGEAIRLARGVNDALPEDPEVAGLLALMPLTDARRPAPTRADASWWPWPSRTATGGTLGLIAEGMALITGPCRLAGSASTSFRPPSPRPRPGRTPRRHRLGRPHDPGGAPQRSDRPPSG